MRRGALVFILAVVVIAGALWLGGGPDAGPSNPCAGTMNDSADEITVVSVQGGTIGPDAEKRSARIVAFGPDGDVRWVHRSGRERGIVWSYDIDPLEDGGLFVTATRPNRTVFYVLDPATGSVRWEETLGLVDTHDADLIDEHRILVANMRAYNETTGENDDRLLVYNRTTDAIEWSWKFRDHGFPRAGGGRYTDDWTHVNDVDVLDDGRYLASVRNFDQVVVIDPATGAVDLRLGEDDAHETLFEQHNPQYLESEDGRPTMLVADSGNDRIVEYNRLSTGEWTRTWTLTGAFTWPRDADRLPGGNTLLVDSGNHRVLEVTPGGEVVWEVYAPWLVYDAERMELGDEAQWASELPTIRELGVTGTHLLEPNAPPDQTVLAACADHLAGFASTTGASRPATTPSGTSGGNGASSPEPATASPGQSGMGASIAVLALAVLAAAGRAQSS